jgi:arginyl-tRNA synthetase
MLKQAIADALKDALTRASAAGELTLETVPEVGVETPRDPDHGDYATNLAMVLAKPLRMPPLKIAETIVRHLAKDDTIGSVSIAAPGFINVRVTTNRLAECARTILQQGGAVGIQPFGQGQRVLLEYVSANPTGPLHVGHARWAVIGSTLANLLQAVGFETHQEFYINDAGNQMRLLGASVDARMQELAGRASKMPEDGYQGAYIHEVAQAAREHLDASFVDLPVEARIATLTGFARDYLLELQKRTLAALNTHFDVFYSETTLHEQDRVSEAIERLKQTGHLYEHEGAWWLRSTAYGDDKDRVVVRENGQPTYLAADIAYHWDKLRRGYDRLIDILGADHHGYVARIRAAVQALGGKDDTLAVVIGQMVNLFRDGEPVRMSKRTGDMVSAQEVVDEVGTDAARYFLVMRSTDSTLDFDLALAKRESADNPVFYVQYAHARICSIIRVADEQGLSPEVGETSETVFIHPSERQLLLKLASYSDEVVAAAKALEPYRLARYAQELASLFHQFYAHCRVLTDDRVVTQARLGLIAATREILRHVLVDLLGVTAPLRMASLTEEGASAHA